MIHFERIRHKCILPDPVRATRQCRRWYAMSSSNVKASNARHRVRGSPHADFDHLAKRSSRQRPGANRSTSTNAQTPKRSASTLPPQRRPRSSLSDLAGRAYRPRKTIVRTRGAGMQGSARARISLPACAVCRGGGDQRSPDAAGRTPTARWVRRPHRRTSPRRHVSGGFGEARGIFAD
jgi:hypothetical protein